MRFFGGLRQLISSIGFIIIGIVTIVIFSAELADRAKTPYSYDDLRHTDYKAGMMVEGVLSGNYGSYAELTDTDDSGKTKTVGYYYLIDAGDEGLISLYTPRKDIITKLERQYSQMGGVVTEYVPFKGKVTKMDEEDVGLYRDYLSYLGLTDDEMDEYAPNLYIKVIDYSSHPVIIVIGAGAVLIGLIGLGIFILRKLRGR